MAVLSGCVATGSSAEAICNIPLFTMTKAEAQSLSNRSIRSIDNFVAKHTKACKGIRSGK